MSTRKILRGRIVGGRRAGALRRGVAGGNRRRAHTLRQQNDTVVVSESVLTIEECDVIVDSTDDGDGDKPASPAVSGASPVDRASSTMSTAVQLESNCSSSTIIFVPDDEEDDPNENHCDDTKQDIHQCDNDDDKDNTRGANVVVDHATCNSGDHHDKDNGVNVNREDSLMVSVETDTEVGVLNVDGNVDNSDTIKKISINIEITDKAKGENDDVQDEEQNSVMSSSSRSIALSFSSFAFSNQEPSCAICMDEFVNGDYVSIPTNERCQHNFHLSCMKDWLSCHTRCPICREVYLDEVTTTVSAPSITSASSVDASEIATTPNTDSLANGEPSTSPARLRSGQEELEVTEATKTEESSDALDDLL